MVSAFALRIHSISIYAITAKREEKDYLWVEESGQVAYSRPSKSHSWPTLTRNYLPEATAIIVSVRHLLLLIL